MSLLKPNPLSYPSPLVLAPLQTHETTLIILHGRGSTAQKFAEPILTHAVSPSPPTSLSSSTSEVHLRSFRDYFPNTKFVFPTAPLRRAAVFKRSLIHQWFDNWSLTQPELKQHLQVPGLRETSKFVHELLEQEIKIVGARRVVLMGLSQGCAASIVSSLLWEGEPFGALVGMCGYLPFRKGMHEFTQDTVNEGDLSEDNGGVEEGLFERDGQESNNGSRFERAVEWLREELQIEDGNSDTRSCSMQSIPVFMGHGSEDEKVPCGMGRLAAQFLRGIDVDVDWNEYEGLGHWYSDDMLQDICQFLKNLKGWEGANCVENLCI
jgi:predicted esterase